MTYEGSCIEDKQPLLGVSVGCIVVVVETQHKLPILETQSIAGQQ
jgi:hypothetical protein